MRIIIDRQRNGRFRVRAEDSDGVLKPIGTFDTREEAEDVRMNAREIGAEKGLPRDAHTVGGRMVSWLKARQKTANDHRRAEQHIISDPIGAVPLAGLRRRDVRRWIDRLREKPAKKRGPGGVYVEASRMLSGKTIRECVTLLSGMLADAIEHEVIAANPAAGIRLPKKSTIALSYLYPDEEGRLMASHVPLPYRMLYGVLAREGMRKGEALGLTWSDLNLEHGVITLDVNKTDDPRSWALDPAVVAALVWWKDRRTDNAPTDRVFVGAFGEPLNTVRPQRFREHLARAGITRAELFERSPARSPIRVHDLRATFVTVSLANGRSETWVADRTGHKSSTMINRYRRAARTMAEVQLGALAPLLEVIRKGLISDPPRSGSSGNNEGNNGAGNGARKLATLAHQPSGVPNDFTAVHALPEAPPDPWADQAAAFCRAILADDLDGIRAGELAAAAAAERFASELTDKARRIRASDPASTELAVRIVDVLVPGGAAVGARRAGGAR